MTGELEAISDAGPSESRREQSSIAFPYLDLDAGIEVANSLYQRTGIGICEVDELAAEMGQTVSSGSFRLKLSTARTFELIDREGRGGVRLSELGRQIVQPNNEAAARAEAFLQVPLYAAVFEKYRGRLLPPARALEREMLGLGVSSKQTDKARQAFERSARQAGFFDSGDDRLVRPRTSAARAVPNEDIDGSTNGNVANGPSIPVTGLGPKMSDNALEYKLVDLMKDDGIEDQERQAIWTLIQYLTRREKSLAPNTGVSQK